jgi:hypothetical protein
LGPLAEGRRTSPDHTNAQRFALRRRTNVKGRVLVFLYFGFGAALAGLALALALGTSPKRAAIVSLFGVVGIIALVVVGFVSADTSPCHDCNAYHGRYLSPYAFFWGR